MICEISLIDFGHIFSSRKIFERKLLSVLQPYFTLRIQQTKQSRQKKWPNVKRSCPPWSTPNPQDANGTLPAPGLQQFKLNNYSILNNLRS
jgi:hypothetical protein